MDIEASSHPLAALWHDLHPGCEPLAHTFRAAYADRWVRFHSLPGSKRYPETEAEYATVLDRHNTVLDELFAGTDVFVVTMDWAAASDGTCIPAERAVLHPVGVRWWTRQDHDDPEPEFHTDTHLYADRRPWERGCVDPLLRAVADELLGEVFVADTELRRIHHPYDGGADVIHTTPEERDRLRGLHTDWLSSHPGGL
ncbi:hypothetical protein [Streptomyces sp. NPDC047525]|uniref:DUF3885 domain-containing protein n=1 Tax=Streptomyces sp. NPDC047525 TaxID=3155264 RepID=UPI0033D9A859